MQPDPTEVILRGIELFNRGEYHASIDTLAPEIVWDTTAAVPDGAAYRGRDEVLRYWTAIPDRWDDFRIEPERTIAGDGVVLLLGRLYGRGADSGVPVETTWDQVWRIENSVPVRCENYTQRDQAWLAAGMEPDGVTDRAAPDLEELLGLAEELALAAGDLSLRRLHHPRSDVRTKSTATDMLSEVDEACERLIVEGIRSTRPDDGILSEEGASAEATSGVRWVIDPIDGTTNYLYGHPGYAISIAVEVHGEVSVGVVVDPIHGERFTAARGWGALRNGEPIVVSDETDLGSALIATGFGYDPVRRIEQAEVLARLIGSIRDIRRMGAAAVDLCSVACGRIDAYYERGLQHWDLAAGTLIAAEAGAVVGELEDGTVIAAPPPLFEPLRDLLAELS